MALLVGAPSALASPRATAPPAGAAALARARDAWKNASFDVAEKQYEAALDAGGLAPSDVVDAYVHIGVALTVMRKYTPALRAFHQAALLNTRFVVPPEAGGLAVSIAERARKEKAKFGGIALGADAPALVQPGASFTVTARLDGAHLTMPSKIHLSVHDGLRGDGDYEDDKSPGPEVAFEVPASATLPGASLAVQVDALDAHGNRLATVEKRVRVETEAASPSDRGPVAHRGSRAAGSPAHDTAEEPEKKSGGGFWSTAWPWVIGGAALAAGGATYYLVTRPPDEVNVTGAHVQAIH